MDPSAQSLVSQTTTIKDCAPAEPFSAQVPVSITIRMTIVILKLSMRLLRFQRSLNGDSASIGNESGPSSTNYSFPASAEHPGGSSYISGRR